MNARRLLLAALVSLAPFVTSALLTPPVALAEESCPNAALRVGFAAGLPDCRGYERVSPPGTHPNFEEIQGGARNVTRGAEMPGEALGGIASVSGDRLVFTSTEPPAGSPSDGPFFLATRSTDGWSIEDLIPPQSTNFGLLCKNAYTVALSPELSSAVLADGYGQRGGTGVPCGTDDPQLVPGEPGGYQNLFLRSESGSYRLVNITPAGASYSDAWFQAASEDLSHVVFSESAQLTPEAPGGEDLYEWSDGVVRLVTFLPDGTPVEGSLANAYTPKIIFSADGPETYTHAVSADGSRVFFYTEGNLYVRENAYEEQSAVDAGGQCTEPAKACTVQLDASQAGGPGGGGKFMWASTSGSKVFFTDEPSADLTANTVPGSGENLYEYDLETGKLSDLTPAAQAEVKGLSGTSEDGSYVYFVAAGALTGQEENSDGAKAESGEPNLYLIHDSATKFIATLASINGACPTGEGFQGEEEPCGADSMDWDPRRLTARVSPNGEYIGFNSVKELTGYDNAPAKPGDCPGAEGKAEEAEHACQEIFLYEAVQNKLSCVSCATSGARPTAPAGIYEPNHIPFGGPEPPNDIGSLQRNVLDDGRIFFNTAEPLVPPATNGEYDVYEYEDGQVHLLSSATSEVGSYFYEASPSGNDVFFNTSVQLPAGNPEAVYTLYDARVDGGFPEPANLTECSEEDCKGAFSAPPAFSAPTSATFVGAGNSVVVPAAVAKPKPRAKPVKCKKGDVKKHNKCVKKPKSKKNARKSAKTNRRASR